MGSGFMLVRKREVHGSGFSVRSILRKGPWRSAVDMVNVGGTLAEAGFDTGLVRVIRLARFKRFLKVAMGNGSSEASIGRIN